MKFSEADAVYHDGQLARAVYMGTSKLWPASAGPSVATGLTWTFDTDAGPWHTGVPGTVVVDPTAAGGLATYAVLYPDDPVLGSLPFPSVPDTPEVSGGALLVPMGDNSVDEHTINDRVAGASVQILQQQILTMALRNLDLPAGRYSLRIRVNSSTDDPELWDRDLFLVQGFYASEAYDHDAFLAWALWAYVHLSNEINLLTDPAYVAEPEDPEPAHEGFAPFLWMSLLSTAGLQMTPEGPVMGEFVPYDGPAFWMGSLGGGASWAVDKTAWAQYDTVSGLTETGVLDWSGGPGTMVINICSIQYNAVSGTSADEKFVTGVVSYDEIALVPLDGQDISRATGEPVEVMAVPPRDPSWPAPGTVVGGWYFASDLEGWVGHSSYGTPAPGKLVHSATAPGTAQWQAPLSVAVSGTTHHQGWMTLDTTDIVSALMGKGMAAGHPYKMMVTYRVNGPGVQAGGLLGLSAGFKFKGAWGVPDAPGEPLSRDLSNGISTGWEVKEVGRGVFHPEDVANLDNWRPRVGLTAWGNQPARPPLNGEQQWFEVDSIEIVHL